MAETHRPKFEDEQPAQMGDNIPPSDAEIFQQDLDEKTKGLRTRIRDLQVGLAKVPEEITDENASLVTDFLGQVQKALRAVEERRVEIKRPIDERASAVQRFFRSLANPLEEMRKPVKARYDAYVTDRERRERARLEAEQRRKDQEARQAAAEAERQQREAETAAREAETDEQRRRAAEQMERAEQQRQTEEDATKAADKAGRAARGPIHTKGTLGAVGFTRRPWVHEIIDAQAIPLDLLRPYLKPEHLDMAIRAYMKAHAEDIKRNGAASPVCVALAGVRIFQDERVSTRAG